MSNRSAKLLLEVSKHLSAHVPAHHKMAGCLSLPVPIGLAEEVTRWAKGYEDWLSKAYDRKIAEEQKRAAERILALKESMTDEDLAAADKIAEQLGFSEPRTADYSAVGERFAELADKTFGRPSEGHRSGTSIHEVERSDSECTVREYGYSLSPACPSCGTVGLYITPQDKCGSVAEELEYIISCPKCKWQYPEALPTMDAAREVLLVTSGYDTKTTQIYVRKEAP